jgi:hypothetical protein
MQRSATASDAANPVAAEIDRLGKLGLGTVTDPQTRTWALRTIFFEVANKKARSTIDALVALSREPFAELKRIGKELLPLDHADFPPLIIETRCDSSVTRRLHHVRDWASLCLAAEHFPSAEQLRTTILDWASERNLNAEWFLDATYLMLCIAAGSPGICSWSYGGAFAVVQGGLRVGGPIGGLLLQLKSSKPLPVLQSYNPAVQNRDEYLLGVQSEFQLYCDEVEKEFRQAGFEPAIQKRQRSGPRWMHVEWFVRNRIELWPQTRIAAEYRVTEDAVSKAVRSTANLLGFDTKGRLRRWQEGRPAHAGKI